MVNRFRLVQIQTTSHCNGGCITCPYDYSWMVKNPGIMSDKLFKKIIDELAEDEQFSGKVCLYLMNEPFCDKKLEKRMEYVWNKLYDPTIELSTNCELATQERINNILNMLDYNTYRKLKMTISFHGINEKQHKEIMKTDWEKSLKNAIYIMKTLDIPICIKSLGFSYDGKVNIESGENIKRFWDNCMNENFIVRNRRYPIRIATHNFHSRAGNVKINNWKYNKIVRKIDKEHKFNCNRLRNCLHILWNGEVVPCCMDYMHKEILGNLNENTIDEVYNGEKYKIFRHQCMGIKESNNDFICKRCESPGG